MGESPAFPISANRYRPSMHSVDWGDVLTWLASIFAGAAFFGALLLLRVESRRDSLQAAVAERLQASLVTAWASHENKVCVLGHDGNDLVVPNSEPRFDTPRDVLDAHRLLLESDGYAKSGTIRAVLYFRDSANQLWKRGWCPWMAAHLPARRAPLCTRVAATAGDATPTLTR